MSELSFVKKHNEVNSLCFRTIHRKIQDDVNDYRYKLGNHFDFDFKYMILRKQTTAETFIHGPGIRVRDYDLLLMSIWNDSLDNFQIVKKYFYEKYKNEIKDVVNGFETSDKSNYRILCHGDIEDDEFLTYMTKYYQIYIIENIDFLVEEFSYLNR